LLIGVVDALVPSEENPHEIHTEAETAPLHNPDAPLPHTALAATLSNVLARKNARPTGDQHKRLLRMGIFTAVAITIHNFPEGLVTFLSALEDPSLGLAIAIAIALHNIPEGISVSVPIFYATGSRKKAFAYSMLSGLAEPFGAGIAFLLMRIFLGGTDGAIPPEVMGILFGGVAGIMVYISLDELLPTSRAYGKGHDSLLGLIAGMVVMSVSLLMMQ
jgi:ZIP family zinc transporter